MQYTQRKLQRSVTEMRRSCIERPSVSRSVPPAKAGAGVRPELIGVTFITMVLLLKNHSRQGYSRGMESMKKRVAVIMQRRPMDNRWQSETWEAVGVLADYDAPGEARVIVEEAGATQWLYPGFEMVLHRSEAEGYYHNVSSQEPRVFVMWRMEAERAVPQYATVSYDEASRWMDGGEQVESVAMPATLFAWVGEFVEKNYRQGPKRRIKRESGSAKAPVPEEEKAPELPPLDSLNFDSDFKAFMHSKVEEGVKRAALKKLFADPRFNVMDGLDTYIDDYSKADPIPEEMLARLEHARQTLLVSKQEEEKPAEEAKAVEPIENHVDKRQDA